VGPTEGSSSASKKVKYRGEVGAVALGTPGERNEGWPGKPKVLGAARGTFQVPQSASWGGIAQTEKKEEKNNGTWERGNWGERDKGIYPPWWYSSLVVYSP